MIQSHHLSFPSLFGLRSLQLIRKQVLLLWSAGTQSKIGIALCTIISLTDLATWENAHNWAIVHVAPLPRGLPLSAWQFGTLEILHQQAVHSDIQPEPGNADRKGILGTCIAATPA